MTTDTFQFQAEAKQLLELMIHSVYSNKEIFLRELISNASDAIDKLKFLALTDKSLLDKEEVFEIKIEADKNTRVLKIIDNGIGMNREEVVQNLGTIAKSGTRAFFEKIKQDGGQANVDLIGRFGVGFYAAFMVADSVTVLTKKAGQNQACLWQSQGLGSYTLADAEKDGHGTIITLQLKTPDPEDGLHDFATQEVLSRVIKKYSDFVTYPIILRTLESDKAEVQNSMKPLWARAQSDVKDEEYNEYYRHLTHDWQEPLKTIVFKAEGTLEYQSLLYIPQTAPMDLYFRDGKRGLMLYVKKILILDNCEDLLPVYLRFVKGVVDAYDLPLNVSREILQHNRYIAQIKKRLAKKTLETLSQIQINDTEMYQKFYKEFGPVLKEGLGADEDNKDKITDLLMFQSTHFNVVKGESPRFTTLKDYISRMKPEQEEIYYLNGESRAHLEHSPHLEMLKERGYEVLFLTDPVDELVTQVLHEYQGKKLKSIAKGDLVFKDSPLIKDVSADLYDTYKPFLEALQKSLDAYVKEVKISKRLTSSAACLVGSDFDLSPHMQRILMQTQKEMPVQKRILEINPEHKIIQSLKVRYDISQDASTLEDTGYLIYGQALLAEGSPLPEPAKFSRLVAELMQKA